MPQEQLHRFGAHARNLQHSAQVGRRLLLQVFVITQLSRCYQLFDLGSQRITDPGDLLNAILLDQSLYVEPGAFQHARRVPVGPGPERVVAKDFQEFCNLVENLADFPVGHAISVPSPFYLIAFSSSRSLTRLS